MKANFNKFYLSLILVLSYFSLVANTTTVTGTILKPSSQAVAVKYTSSKPDQEQAFVNASLDANNMFYLQFELYEFVEAYLYVGKDYVCKFYLEPGETVNIGVDMHYIDQSLSFDGTQSAKNKFWVEFNRQYPEFNEKVFYYKPFNFYSSNSVERLYQQQASIENFYASVDANYNNHFNFLNSFNNYNSLSSENYQRILANFEARRLNDRIFYFYYQQSLMKSTNADIPFDLQQTIQNYDKQSFEQLENKEYVNAMMAYLGYLNTKNQRTGPKETAEEYYQLIINNFIGITRNYLLTRLFLKEIANKRIDLWESKRQEYTNFNFTDEWLLMIDGAYHQLSQIYNSITNTNFTLPDKNKENVSLTDYRGKVIYLSFWATWCKPCLDNFEKYRHIKYSLEDKGVVFVNVSIDKNRDKAIEYINRIGIDGVNLFADDDLDSITQQFYISSLPTYYTIDQYGAVTAYSGNLADVQDNIKNLIH